MRVIHDANRVGHPTLPLYKHVRAGLACSITLFPSVRDTRGSATEASNVMAASTTVPAQANTGDATPLAPAAVRTGAASPCAAAAAAPAPDTPTHGRGKRNAKGTRQAAADADAAPAAPPLAWGNTCTFRMSGDRKLAVERPPDWHVTCTAAHHAAHAEEGVVTAAEFDARVRACDPAAQLAVATLRSHALLELCWLGKAQFAWTSW